AFLKLCPQVERVRLGWMDAMLMKILRTLLQITCPKLRRLDWINCGMDSDESIAELLQGSKFGWRELHLPDMLFFEHQAFAALVQRADRWEILQLEGVW